MSLEWGLLSDQTNPVIQILCGRIYRDWNVIDGFYNYTGYINSAVSTNSTYLRIFSIVNF